ncbi:zinc finger, CCHC-type containing protein [Tanacetum coccineum]
MHFLLSSMSVVYVLITPIPEDGENATIEQIRKRNKYDNDDYVCRELWDSLDAKYMAEDASSKKFLVSNFTNYKMTNSRLIMEQYNELLGIFGRFTKNKMNMDEAIHVSCIIDKLPPSWKDFKHTLKHNKEELTLVELGSHLRIEESLKAHDSDKPKGNNVFDPLVINMVKHNNSFRYNDDKGKRKHQGTKANPNKKSKVTCWKCGNPGHLKKDCNDGKVSNKANGSGTNGSVDGSTNSLKGHNMFNKSLQVYYVTYVSEAYFVYEYDVAWWVDSGATVHVYLRFSFGKIVSLFNVLHVPNIRKNLFSSSILNNCGYKQVIESNKFVLSNHGVFVGLGYLSNQMLWLNIVNDNIASAFMSTSKLNDSILWHARLGQVHFKRMQDMSKDGLILSFDMDTEKCKTCMLTKITKKPFQNVRRETKVLELIHNDLGDLHATPSSRNKKYFVTFINDASRTDRGGEYIDTLYFQSVGIIHEMIAPYTPQQNGISDRKNRVLKEMVNSMLSCSGLSLGLWGEAMLTACYLLNKDFGFYVIEPNESILINSIIESRDAIFDENRFSSIPRPSQRSLMNGTEDIGALVVPEEVTKKEQGMRSLTNTPIALMLRMTPKFDEAMKSQDIEFWKETINDEIDSILGNNT